MSSPSIRPLPAQFSEALLSADAARGNLAGEERNDAERLVELVRGYLSVPGRTDDEATRKLRRETVRLVEVLARRSAEAMPYAALGRALLATTQGDEAEAERLLAEFTTKLSMLGF